MICGDGEETLVEASWKSAEAQNSELSGLIRRCYFVSREGEVKQ